MTMNFLMRIRDQLLPKYAELIGLAVLIALVLTGNLVWIAQDTSPSTGVDANVYMRLTLIFTDKMDAQGLDQFWHSFADMQKEGRPPLYQLMSVPFILLFGRSMDSGLYLNLAFEILLLVAVYNIGRLIKNGKAGLLAAVITAGLPPLIDLSLVYRPHFAVAACVTLTVWLLLLLQKKRSVNLAWFFGLSLAFGLWIHPSYIQAVLIPAILFSLYLAFFQPQFPQIPIRQLPAWFLGKAREPLVWGGLLPAFLLSAILVLCWYVPFGDTLLSTLATMNSPQTIDLRGFEIITVGFADVPPSFWWYVITSPRAVSTVFASLLGIGIVASLLSVKFTD